MKITFVTIAFPINRANNKSQHLKKLTDSPLMLLSSLRVKYQLMILTLIKI